MTTATRNGNAPALTASERLLTPFPAEQTGILPRVTCSACSKKTCNEHRKSRCNECGSWISERHIHLSYVGHADVTRRLLEVDPTWTWEPLAVDEHGLPLLDTDDEGNPVGLWIKLTVDGVTRLGYGSCPSDQSDAVKVLIGDALRNAAMRFGVAVDLWAKGDRTDPSAENPTANAGQARQRRATRPELAADPAQQELLAEKKNVLAAHKAAGYGSDPATIGETFERLTGMTWAEAKDDPAALRVFVAALQDDVAARNGQQDAS